MKVESIAGMTADESRELAQKLGQHAAMDPEGFTRLMSVVHTRFLLEAIKVRGGHPGAVAEACLLCMQKDADYNQGLGVTGDKPYDPHAVVRDAYFPFGMFSYAQMLHVKASRLVSLCKKGSDANNESFRDTCLDLINYAGFAADWLTRTNRKEAL